MIRDDGYSCGNLMVLQPVELFQNYISDLIYFAHMVPVLVIILNLQNVLLLLMIDGKMKLLLFLVIWGLLYWQP